MGGCQNYGHFLGTLNIRCRIIIGIHKGTTILTTTHIQSLGMLLGVYVGCLFVRSLGSLREGVFEVKSYYLRSYLNFLKLLYLLVSLELRLFRIRLLTFFVVRPSIRFSKATVLLKLCALLLPLALMRH